jgi:hypothetical protein
VSEEQEPINREMTFEDIAALAIATALYLGKDDPTIIDTIGATAESIKEKFVDGQNESEPA